MQTPSITILFADIVDSTKLYSTLGDEQAKTLIAEGINLLSEIVRQQNGKLIKTIGDEIMASFSAVPHAADAALLMQGMMKTSTLLPDTPPGLVKIRLGMHFGPVIEEENDIFGNSVNIASRIVGLGKANQILISKDFKEALPINHAFHIRLVDRAHLKGLNVTHEIFEMLPSTDTEGITVATLDDIPLAPYAEAYLNLHIGARTLRIEPPDAPITLGRSEENQIVVPIEQASRLHSRIEWKKGHFVVVDQSLNGTFMRFENGALSILHREEMFLKGKGIIGLGRDVVSDPTYAIRFESYEVD